MYFRYFVTISPWKKGRTLYSNTHESPSPKDALSQVWLYLAVWFLKRRFVKFTITLLSPLGKGLGPSFEQTWIPITQGCFVPTLVEIGPVVLSKVRQCIFAIWLLSPLRKGQGHSFEQTWLPITQGCFVPVWLKLALWFLRIFLKFVNVFTLFRYYLPLENGGSQHLNKLEYQSPKDVLCLV